MHLDKKTKQTAKKIRKVLDQTAMCPRRASMKTWKGVCDVILPIDLMVLLRGIEPPTY